MGSAFGMHGSPPNILGFPGNADGLGGYD